MLNPDGSGTPFWTLPIIHDSESGQYISNSFDIALFLDQKFPDKPLLFPSGTKNAVQLFDTYFMEKVLGPICFAPSCDRIDAKSQLYFRKTRERWFGAKLEDLCPKGPARHVAWNKLRSTFNSLSGPRDGSNSGAIYYFGDTISYADFIVSSFIYWHLW